MGTFHQRKFRAGLGVVVLIPLAWLGYVKWRIGTLSFWYVFCPSLMIVCQVITWLHRVTCRIGIVLFWYVLPPYLVIEAFVIVASDVFNFNLSTLGITKCDRLLLQSAPCITKCDKLLSQSASGITKCDSYYKVRRYTSLIFRKRFRSKLFQVTFHSQKLLRTFHEAHFRVMKKIWSIRNKILICILKGL